MTTDNRTNEPTPEQVEAAAKAIYGDDPAWGYVNDYGGGEFASQWRHLGESVQEMFRLKARAALVAAQGAAPQAESSSTSRIIDLAEKWADEKIGGYIARASFMQGVRFALNETVTPVLPSSGVDEDALAKYRSRQKQETTNYREWKRQNRGYGIPELLAWAREAQDNVRFAAGWITHEDYRRAVVPQNIIPLLESLQEQK